MISTESEGVRMRPAPKPVPRRYVFARPVAFDLECPRCGAVDVARRHHPWWRRRENFNAVTRRWRCRTCRQIWAVGLALWPVRRTGNRQKGPVRPADVRPKPDQLPELRELYGIVRRQPRGRGDPVNLVCHCLERDVDPACPFHGWDASQTSP